MVDVVLVLGRSAIDGRTGELAITVIGKSITATLGDIPGDIMGIANGAKKAHTMRAFGIFL